MASETLRIGYRFEPIADYAKGLTDADTLPKLHALLERFRLIAADAIWLVDRWTVADFNDWRKALASERRGKFMGEPAAERFAAVLMPEVMFRVGVVADKYKCPWGLAYIRMKDVGQIEEVNGIARMKQEPR